MNKENVLGIIDSNKRENVTTKDSAIIIKDSNYKKYVSLNDFLADYQSFGPYELPGGLFKHYAQGTLSIHFLQLLLKENNNISKVVCLPNLNYCIYIKPGTKFKDLKAIVTTDEYCERLREYPDYRSYTRGIIKSNLLFFNPPEYSQGKKTYRSINNHNIVIPDSIKIKIENCEKKSKHIVFLNLFLISTYGDKIIYQHSNIIIFNLLLKTIERFDPHGGSTFLKERGNRSEQEEQSTLRVRNLKRLYKQELIDEILKDKFKIIFPDYKYLNLYDTCPYIGPQIYADAFNGLCMSWSLMYFVLRVINPDVKQSEINKMMIKGTKKEVLDKILRFNKFVIEYLKNAKNLENKENKENNFGVKRSQSPEKFTFETYTIFESSPDVEEQQINDILNDPYTKVGDYINYYSSNQMDSKTARIMRNKDGTKKLGRWKYADEENF